MAVDPSLTDVAAASTCCSSAVVEQDLAAARQAAQGGQVRRGGARVHDGDRQLARQRVSLSRAGDVEAKRGKADAALADLQKAVALEPARRAVDRADRRSPRRPRRLRRRRAVLRAKRSSLEPSDAVEAKLEALRASAELARLPAEYRAIDAAPQLTRGDLAALIGVRLPALVQSARRRDGVVITDVRTHWAATWIMAVARAGIMDPFDNHTFQPNAVVRRADLAIAMSRLLARLAVRIPPADAAGLPRVCSFTDLAADASRVSRSVDGRRRRRDVGERRHVSALAGRDRRRGDRRCLANRHAGERIRGGGRLREFGGAMSGSDVLTPANQLTLLRMFLIPAFVVLVVEGELGWALVVFATAGVTDALDGVIARRSGQKTTLGAWLDPMADKLMLVSAFVVLTLPGLGLANRLPIWLTALIISRDVGIVITVAIVNLAIGRRTFQPSMFGKIATAIYIVTAVLAMLFNYLGYHSRIVDVAMYTSLGDHAALGLPLHLACRQGAGRAGAIMIAFLLAWLLGTPAGVSRAPKQAVVETTAGTFVIDLAPEQAPLTTAYFMKTASAGGFNGTIFHKMIKYGIVQGGDPLSKDPSKRAQWGTGGLNAVKDEATGREDDARIGGGRHDSRQARQRRPAVLRRRCRSARPRWKVHGASDTSRTASRWCRRSPRRPIDDKGVATERVEIKSITIRDTPPVLFVNDSVPDLASYRAVLDTSAGPITIEFFPEKAQETVRQFLRLADAGVYNDVAFHRVAPGFVIQTGALNTRATPLTEKQQKLVHNLTPEFNDTKHVKGIVSMARGEAPDSATTSFFICTGASTALDGQYTAFGRVVDGMAAVEAIEQTPRDGETPKTRIELRSVKIEKR